MVVDLSVKDRASERRCPYCHALVTLADDGWVCANCGAIHHRDCYREHGRCSVHGCSQSAGTVRPSACAPLPAPANRRRWLVAIGALASTPVLLGSFAILSPSLESGGGIQRSDPSGPTHPAPWIQCGHPDEPPSPPRARRLPGVRPDPLGPRRDAQPSESNRVSGVAFAGDDRVVTASEAGNIDLYDANTGELRGHVGHEGTTTFCEFATSGRLALLGTPFDTGVEREDLSLVNLALRPPRLGRIGRTFRDPVSWRRAKLSPSARHALIVASDSRFEVWDLPDEKCVAELEGHDMASALEFRSDERAFMSGDCTGRVRVWNITSHWPISVLSPMRGEIVALSMRSDGLCAVAATTGAKTTLFCLDLSGTVSHEVSVDASTHALAFENGGRRAVSCDSLGGVYVWDVERASVERLENDGVFEHAAVSPEGRRFVTASEAGPVRVREMLTGRILVEFSVR